ncbi:MAG: alpha/beta hydrolase [Brevinemataceae bacterium]
MKILLGVVVFSFYISAKTMIFRKKSTKDLFKKKYTHNEDIWIKKEGNKNLLVILHGMYSNPKIFEEFGHYICSEGWDVFLPALPNSSNSQEDLMNQDVFPWDDSVKIAFQKTVVYTNGYEKFALAGHSQGGSLAMAIAPSLDYLSGVIIAGSPISLLNKHNKFSTNFGICMSGLCSLFPKFGVKLKKHSQNTLETNPLFQPKNFYYALTLHSMQQGLARVKKNLKNITQPCLLIYDKNDTVINITNSIVIKQNIQSSIVKTKIVDSSDRESTINSHYLFNNPVVKNEVFEEIKIFLNSLPNRYIKTNIPS